MISTIFAVVIALLLCDTYAIKLMCEKKATQVFQTEYGPIQGCVHDDVMVFRGVPFAAPPIGDNRWRAPQPPMSWNTTLKVYDDDSKCPQFDITGGAEYLGTEDCLYLDIYVPVGLNASEPVPVFNWIYGGAFVLGDKYEFGMYDAKNIVRDHGYIVVAGNYRLGAFGFLAMDELKREDEHGSTGNYAMQDQVMVLQWIQDNIGNFGGDPHRVTILGESAGGFSTCWHIGSPSSKGLFHAVVMESGTCDGDAFYFEYNAAKKFSEDKIKHAGCTPKALDVLGCMRDLETKSLLEWKVYPDNYTGEMPPFYPVMPWGFVIDGATTGTMDVTLNLIKNGTFNAPKGIIAGTNKQEGALFVPAIGLVVPGGEPPLKESTFNMTLSHFFNDSVVTELMEMYPEYEYKDSYDGACAEVLTDWIFACPARRGLRALSEQGVKNTYMYHFCWNPDWIDTIVLGDYHSVELEFVFDNPLPLIHPFNAKDKEISAGVTQFWSNLVWDYNVNGNDEYASSSSMMTNADNITWPAWDPVNRLNLVIDLPWATETDLKGDVCDYWDRVSLKAQN